MYVFKPVTAVCPAPMSVLFLGSNPDIIRHTVHETCVTIFALSAGSKLTKINIGNTGNQNHPDLEVRVVLVTCFSSGFGYLFFQYLLFLSWKPAGNAKMVN